MLSSFERHDVYIRRSLTTTLLFAPYFPEMIFSRRGQQTRVCKRVTHSTLVRSENVRRKLRRNMQAASWTCDGYLLTAHTNVPESFNMGIPEDPSLRPLAPGWELLEVLSGHSGRDLPETASKTSW
jgi:hypothetical protein